MNEICGDNRFEIIAKAKAHLLDATNIDTSEDEMKVLDSFLFRCWQMGWLDRYDRRTESSSEKPNNFDKDINVRSKDEPQVVEKCDRPQMDCENCWRQLHCRVKDEPQTSGYQTFNGTSVYVSRLEDEPQLTPNYCGTCKHREVPCGDLPCDACHSYSNYEPMD